MTTPKWAVSVEATEMGPTKKKKEEEEIVENVRKSKGWGLGGVG